MAGVTSQQQVGKEERKMGRGWEEAGGYVAAHQYLALHQEQEVEEEGEGGDYIGSDCHGDKDEEEGEAGVGKGGKSPRAQHRRQYRNRKYRRLAQHPSSEGLTMTMSSSNSNSSLLLSNDSNSSSARRSRSDSMGVVGGEEIEEKGRASTVVPVGGMHPGGVGLGKGKQFLFRPPQSPASSPNHSNSSNGTSTSTNGSSKCTPRTRPKRGGSSTNTGCAAASSASSSSGSTTRNRRRAALKAEEAIHRAQGGREGANEGGSDEEDSHRRSSSSGGGRRRKPNENGREDEDEDGGEGELDEALMNLRFPAQHETDFVGAVFKLGLKCSSPKVLMDLMPITETLTTEHIKSHLQKYRLHGNRSKEEFVEVRWGGREGGRKGGWGGGVYG
eukprot:evm.model.NODE_45204_length_19404_cov_34.534840.2